MRLALALIAVGLLAACGQPATRGAPGERSGAVTFPASPASSASPTPQPSPQPGLPVRLQIPALEIDSPITPVGLVRGAVGTPCDPRAKSAPCDVNASAWYNGSVRPGEPGDAVIDGHVDWYGPAGSNHDIPAVFANLAKLKVGATITIAGDDGISRNFVVSALIILPYPQQPPQTYATSGPPMVTLITCIGVYVNVGEGMDHRLYVQATEV